MFKLKTTVKDSRSTRCVLCVAHSPQTRGALIGVLQECGLSADIFTTADQCLPVLYDRQYDLLLVDCDGDTSSAVELLAQSRRMVRQTPAVLLVERGDVNTAVRAIKAGGADCVEKPIEATRLIPALNAILSQTDFRGPDCGTALTKAESAVLHYTFEGRTSREIAGMLCRSHRTIEVHRRSIMRKFGVTRLIDLIKKQAAMGRL